MEQLLFVHLLHADLSSRCTLQWKVQLVNRFLVGHKLLRATFAPLVHDLAARWRWEVRWQDRDVVPTLGDKMAKRLYMWVYQRLLNLFHFLLGGNVADKWLILREDFELLQVLLNDIINVRFLLDEELSNLGVFLDVLATTFVESGYLSFVVLFLF